MRQHHRLIFRSLFRARVYDVKTDEYQVCIAQMVARRIAKTE